MLPAPSLLTLLGRGVGGGEAHVGDGRVCLEAEVHGALGGLQHGGHLVPTEGPQQGGAGRGAVPHLTWGWGCGGG